MNTKLVLLFFLIILVSFGVTSCGDDDGTTPASTFTLTGADS